MSEIKSKKAIDHVFENVWDDVMLYNKKHAFEAILIAETEAEQRHANELQKLRDKVLDIVCIDLSTSSTSYQQLETLFTQKLTENKCQP